MRSGRRRRRQPGCDHESARAPQALYAIARPLVVGDAKRLGQAGQIVRSGLAVRLAGRGRRPSRASSIASTSRSSEDTPFGKLSTACGEAAYRSSSAR
jgi:4-hydroxythreonine-4-phosphate dehydrogenase